MEVTVIVPTRHRPALLEQALRSALAQQDVAFEVLVVNDGGAAAPDEVAARLADRRVRVLRNAGPEGVSGARNTGIAAAASRWIAFLDDDDLWAPWKLRSQIDAAESAAAAWVYGGDVTVDASLRVIAGAPPPDPPRMLAALRRHNAVPAGSSNVVVRRDAMAGISFDPALRTSEDWDVWLKLARRGAPASVDRPLVAVRSHPRMASRDVDQMIEDVGRIAARHHLPVDRARHERWAAWTCLEDGRTAAAVKHYARAVLSGDLASVGRAAVAVIRPDLARTPAPAVTPWTEEAQEWIDALRLAAVEAPTPPVEHADA